MSNYVVDTNVIMAANFQHDELSDECSIECITRLNMIKKSGVVFVDQPGKIISEYSKNTTPYTGNRVGDIFLKWLINQQGNRCKQVQITETSENEYTEFTNKELQIEFDPPDRKFIAVAQASGVKITILQAADCKWLNWNASLKEVDVVVEFVCPDDICKFYESKFPGQDIPDLT